MRNIIIWTLTLVLGFEPALMAQGQARQNNEIKAFLEMAEIGKRPVTFKELYNKFSDYLPQAQKQELKHFMQNYGHLQIPKMDISKIKLSGSTDEIYKLQVVQNGQSGSIEFTTTGKTFARVNGQVLTAADMRSTANVLAKAGVPQQALGEFKRVKDHPDLLSSAEFAKLQKADQKKYLNDYREWMASMESVQQVDLQRKTAASDDSSAKFEVIARLLRGENAFAMNVGDVCVAGGHITKVARDGGGRLTCGTDGKDGVPEELRKRPGLPDCAKNEFACNSDLYGANGSICIRAGKDTTRGCNDFITKNPNKDIPETANSLKTTKEAQDAWNKLSGDAKTAAEQVAGVCADIRAKYPAQAADVEAIQRKGGKKKAQKNPAQGLIDDQLWTCENFDQRKAVIDSWGCDNSDFKTKYQKICGAREAEGEVGVVPGERPPTPPPAGGDNRPPAPPQLHSCDGYLQYSLQPLCEGGSSGRPEDKTFDCLGSDGKPVGYDKVYECFCYDKDGRNVGPKAKNKCGPSGSTGSVEKEKDGFFKRNKKWLIPLGAGLLGLFVYHWLAKKSVKQNYEYLEPVQPLPPLPPPSVAPTAPVPRGVN